MTILVAITIATNLVEANRIPLMSRNTGSDNPLRGVTILNEPYVMLKKNSSDASNDNNKTEFKGFLIDLMDQIAQRNGLKYELYLVPDSMYGIVTSNGTINGMIGQVYHGVSVAIVAIACLLV